MIATRIWFALTVTLLLTIIATPSFAQSNEQQEPAAQPDRSGSGGNGIDRQRKGIAGRRLAIHVLQHPDAAGNFRIVRSRR